ncbi:MAG: LysE family transporter [Thermovirgaceae bacterium]|nr:LysE family transporter [Thermovirgaceae bacterium]
MNGIDLLTLIPYVFITTFTPGPNNISCAASAARWGLSRTWGYLFGIASGFFVLLTICGAFSGLLMSVLPWLQTYMRWVGAAYILWLAYGIARSDTSGGIEGASSLRGFAKGFVLQFVNPKAILYGVTLYTAFLSPILARPLPVFISAVLFAVIGFSSILTWAVFGLGIERFLQSPMHRKIMNGCFALLLVYTAAGVAGLL